MRTFLRTTLLLLTVLALAASCSSDGAGGRADAVGGTTEPPEPPGSSDVDEAGVPPEVRTTDEVTIPGLTLVNLRAGDDGALYARELGTRRLVRLDPSSGEVVASVEVPGELDEMGRLFFGVIDGRVWATIPQTGLLHELDADTLSVVRDVPLPTTPAGNYWIHPTDTLIVNGYGDDEAVWLVDPVTGSVGPRFATSKADGSVAAFGAIWVANVEAGTVSRLDPDTGEELAVIEVGDLPGQLGVTAEAMWVSFRERDEIARIDPATNEVTSRTETVPGSPRSTTAAAFELDGTVWTMASSVDGRIGGVAGLDPRSGARLGVRRLPGEPGGLQAAGGRLLALVNDGDDSRLLTIDTGELLGTPR